MPKVTPDSFDIMHEDTFEFTAGDLTVELKNPTESDIAPLREAIISEIRANEKAEKPYKRDQVPTYAPQAWVDTMTEIDRLVFDGYTPRQKRLLYLKLTVDQVERLQMFAVDCIDLDVIVKVLNENEDTSGN